MSDWSWHEDWPDIPVDDEHWTVLASLKRETEKAILVECGEIEAWLPKSQIKYEPEGDKISVAMPLWLAEEKGLDSYDRDGESLDDEIPF